MFIKTCLFFLLALVCLAKAQFFDVDIEPEPTVFTPVLQTKFGKIRGLVRHSEDREVNFYNGIRYGHAGRFEKPTMVSSWQDVYDATHVRGACPQPGFPGTTDPVEYAENVTNTKVSSEDCLFLNVWTPTKHTHNMPVMVWIHGGTFKTGTIFSLAYDARHIASLGQVVVVTVNYRLGPFGFLAGDDAKHPGNAGLYDMRLALQWVQENIAHFGGNAKDVTIFGESAGGMAVGALVLSPLTHGLFHRAILQSGAPNSYLGSEDKSKSLPKTKSFAEKFNCTSDKYEAMIECLKTPTIDQIIEATANDLVNNEEFIPVFGETFLPQNPEKELLSFNRSIDLLFGVTSNEGIGFIRGAIGSILNLDDIDLNKVKTTIFFFAGIFKLNNANEIIDYYTKHLTANSSKDEMFNALADAFADFHLVCPTMLFGEAVARQHAKIGKQHHYYAYRFEEPIHIELLGCKPEYGVCHGIDVLFLFGHPVSFYNKTVHFEGKEINITPKEYRFSKRIIDKWTHFAHTGVMGMVEMASWTQAVDVNAKPKDITVNLMELKDGAPKMTHGFYRETCDKFWRPTLFPDEKH